MQQADDDACEATRQELTMEVQALHAACKGNPVTQQAFSVPVQVLLNRRNRALKQWLNKWRPTLSLIGSSVVEES